MTDSRNTKALAVDGGGTRCRIALQDGAKVVSVTTGPANVSTDFECALIQINDGLHALCETAPARMEDLARLPVFIGLAGITGPELATRLRDALPFETLRIEDDRPAALRGALGDRDGVIAHCGTGSFYGAQIGGAMRFSGGWGSVLGDEASAQWVGRMALGITLETTDERAEASDLSKALLERFDGTAGIVRFAGSARPADFGALAPDVTDAGRKGDSLALKVLNAGAREIARSLPAIGWTPGIPICLTGGIGPEYEPYLPEEMRAVVTPAAGEPLTGALSLALDLTQEQPQ